ncbi:peptidoglycan DD-metalloendopeptidase family protein [Virgibacillus pantothenticus]|uniref:peptidoglycan DD-metalloendopeptidase family protein n=2 Tax=Virgibacillus pantothenticus TaxID=1473 RepID=UPI0020B3CC94|nr:peptidoglycan DD-metalloendopeptidase family protein [Virgibacillus pantothenticus]MEB5452855.1 peptidoglycan DD-metalloendopeptidase family protein [Virgibacillus pantothenticus]MEB5456957.1 peptidoglycan DD-metalloendopeptidase family protein [Virgibacillus pantothenticus]MEB5462074.1 peptidoglycan DD-metalloendopeptidase family protein [Virgibacillus pantothenticus]MEB5465348.1 peptidoglycan DD-metalloendopeptidase family protein [Virgibacillus pantothenticus]MEB5469742.1 peptidoglycan D
MTYFKKFLYAILLSLSLTIFISSTDIAHASDEIEITKSTAIYDKPSFDSKTGAFIKAPQTVKVLERKDNGWMKVKTWFGDKWIAPNGVQIKLTFNTRIYNDDNLLSSTPAFIEAQTLTVFEIKDNGWWRVDTWLGERWIAPNGIKEYLPKKTEIFNKPTFNNSTGAFISPQEVTVISKRASGWWLVKTWLGNKWIAPNGESLKLDREYKLYSKPSFNSKTSGAISPQTVKVVDEKKGGWLLIETWTGNKWINIKDNQSKFILPIKDSYTVTSTYGSRGSSFHYGIDLANNRSGVKILSSAAGVVTRAEYSSSYGYVVYVEHNINNQKYTTVYAHMRSNLQVKKGQRVNQGQVLGYMGNTGQSTGQHLHFEIHKGSWQYRNGLDPELFLDF